MECGSEASAHAEANASALQTGQRAAPLSHDVGEGLGVRAESGRTLPTANPSDVPLSAPARRERGIMECGSEASAHAEANASALQTRLFPMQRTQVLYPYQGATPPLLTIPPLRGFKGLDGENAVP